MAEQPSILGFSPSSKEFAAQEPVIRVRTPAGDMAWMVTGHAEIRKLAVDGRIGRTHPDPENAPRYFQNPLLELWRSSDFASEHEAHTALRAMLAPYFSARSMNALGTRVAVKVNAAVARLGARTPPADLNSQFALPLTVEVLGELVGVPEEDNAAFAALMGHIFDAVDAPPLGGGTGDPLFGYLRELAARKRAEPGDDVLSGLAAEGNTDEQCAGISLILLRVGITSPPKHTVLGLAKIMSEPDLRMRLTADPALMKPAVEELLRTASSDGFLFPHYAREDIAAGGVTIAAGELVLLNYQMANFDESVFPAPDEIDITRSPNPHLTFSHGMWHCTGAPLARMQLTMTFNALLAALPTLRLAESREDLAAPGYQRDPNELLVTW
jgi:cytochrome P450 monooxygenase